MGQSGTTAAVTVHPEGGAALTLSGNVTILVADQLVASAREAAEHGDVTVDLSEVEHVDTAGLQVLLALRKTLHSRARRLVLRRVPEGVARFLAVSGLSLLLDSDTTPTHAATEDEA